MAARSDFVDVLVVGSGPAGAVVTHALATRGFRVTCLEQGDWVNPSDFAANYPEWELLCRHRWHQNPNIRGLASDYPVETSDSEVDPIMFNAVGGSSLYYGAEWPRLLPSDFRVKTLDGIADDWPISYDDLKPYHDEVDRFIGVAGLDGDTAYPPGLTYPLPPHPIGRAGRQAAVAANELGWHWWPGTNAIASWKYQTLEPCARWGTCEWGCPAGAKASFDLIYMPQAMAAGAQLVTGARVREIVASNGDRADGVIWIDRDGGEHRQRASAIVLCANGIGTPRLLLNSVTPAHPDGLANSSGLVGRNLMLHPNCGVIGFYDEVLRTWHGPAGQLIHSLEFYETRPDRDFVRGAKMHVIPFPGPVNAVDAHGSLPYERVWGEAFHTVVRRHAGAYMWATNVEDLPEDHNCVVLDDELTDGAGIPAPKVNYRMSENTRRVLRFCVERQRELHEVAGAAEIIEMDLLRNAPGHLLGTARMGDDPATSVVDSYGRSHDVHNLFIADGSIFVTGGAANPTATITALALRVAKAIAATAALSSSAD